jgi:hypothetical protein
MKKTAILSFLSILLLAASATAADPAVKPGLPPAAGSAAAPAPAGAAPATPTASGKLWADMNKKERKQHMKEVVMPKMKELFVEFDAKHFAKMDCATCHGAGATNGKFKMPNPKLPKLPADEAGFQKLAAEKPKAAEFMGTKVKPTMASLLGLPEYDPKTKTGVGCFACHMQVTTAAAK